MDELSPTVEEEVVFMKPEGIGERFSRFSMIGTFYGVQGSVGYQGQRAPRIANRAERFLLHGIDGPEIFSLLIRLESTNYPEV